MDSMLKSRPGAWVSWGDFLTACRDAGGTLYGGGPEGQELCLLVSHELTMTGAPIALREMARLLPRLGLQPLVISPKDGPMRDQLRADGIPVAVIPSLFASDFVFRVRGLFSLVVANTIITAPVVKLLNGTDTPVLWWVHEAKLLYQLPQAKELPHWLFSNVKCVTAGPWAMEGLAQWRPYYALEELLFSIPDMAAGGGLTPGDTILPPQAAGKKVFALVGTIQKNKGQDVLAQAIGLLPPQVLEGCYFLLVGDAVEPDVEELVARTVERYPDNVGWIRRLSREEMAQFYREIHCLISASRDECMGMTMVEASQFQKLIISSENTGFSAFLKRFGSGLTFPSENASALAACIRRVWEETPGEFDEMRRSGREVYETFFTEDAFVHRLEEVLSALHRQCEADSPALRRAMADAFAQTLQDDRERDPDCIATFFFDVGTGYSESCKQVIPFDSQQPFGTEISLPAGTVSVRFDPVEGHYCVVRNLSVMSDRGLLPFQIMNGFRAEDLFLFRTTDPQIQIPLPGPVQWLKVQGEVRCFDDAPLLALLEALFASQESQRRGEQELAQVQEELTQRLSQVQAELTQRLSQAQVQREELSQHLAQVQAELTQRLSQVQTQREELSQHLAQVQTQREELTDRLAQVQTQREELTDRLARVQTQREELSQRLAQAQVQREELEAALKKAEVQRAALLWNQQAREEVANRLTQVEKELKHSELLRQDLQTELDRTRIGEADLEKRLFELEQNYLAYQDHSQQELAQVRQAELAAIQTRDQLSVSLSNLQESYNAISDAQLWKISAPLRKLLDRIKGTRLGGLIHKAARYWRMFGFRSMVRKVLQFLKGDRYHPPLPAAEAVPGGTAEPAFGSVAEFANACRETGAVFGEELLTQPGKQLVLLISHELNLTGAPVALEQFALSLQRLGFAPVMMAPRDDVLRERLCGEGIPVLTNSGVYTSELVPRAAALFPFLVICTNVGGPLVARLSGGEVPVLWWIHEAEASYHQAACDAMPTTLGANIHVYCGGEHANRVLHRHFPLYPSNSLLYSIPDPGRSAPAADYPLRKKPGQTVFALVGMLEHRKGQDILTRAIRLLDPQLRKGAYFVFVGRQCYPQNYEAIMAIQKEFPENVEYIPEIPRDALAGLYQAADVLICASRDDPMPIVVTEAMALSMAIICSENTGSAPLLEGASAGLIYRKDSPAELAECIRQVLAGEADTAALGRQARQVFEDNFTEEAFDRSLTGILQTLLGSGRTYSAFLEDIRRAKGGGVKSFYNQETMEGFQGNGKRNILLISHEFSRTGAPLVLVKLARVLRRQGNNVTILSPFDGPVRETLAEDGFPVVIFEKVYDITCHQLLRQYAGLFDLILINTVVTFRAVWQLGGLLTPVVWWIHDSRASYTYGGFGDIMPKELPSNVRVLCGGAYARDCLLNWYPNYQAEVLLYAIDDCAARPNQGRLPDLPAGRKVFLVIGTLELRKGQDIAVKAIRSLPQDQREKCVFVFAGKEVEAPIKKAVLALRDEMPDQVRYVEQLNYDDLVALYRRADCLICCSRDDPMPVVVTEMQALSQVVICSENTGSAELIRRHGGGLLYENDDPKELAHRIQYVLNAPAEELEELGRQARSIYETAFSQESFDREVRELVEQECSPEQKCQMAVVSVVIPTYNAGESFGKLMETLTSQTGVAKVEIVVVDSGSTDGTQDVAKQWGAKLIQIDQSTFSHSFARNLGAKEAQGSVLIFMTQDALPSGRDWARQMALPILSGEAAAVSCREECPPETDLFYRVASWYHAHYLGIDKESQLGSLTPGMSPEAMRKAASLNDVSTAVDRELFLQYGYRHSFAEDLDLGMRLLKRGQRVKLLHSPTVIHGHTRPASYYLRRGLAEGRALERIMGTQGSSFSALEAADRIVPGYQALQNVFAKLRARQDYLSLEDFSQAVTAALREELASPQPMRYGGADADPLVEDMIRRLSQLRGERTGGQPDLAHGAAYYCSEILRVCLRETGWVTSNFAEQLCPCMYKQSTLIMGNLLAHISSKDPNYEEFQQLRKGV